MLKARVYFDVEKKSRLNINYINHDFEKSVFFEIPDDFFISADSLAALVVVCRPFEIKEIDFNFPITSRVKEIIQKEYGIKVCDKSLISSGLNYFSVGDKFHVKNREHSVLSFSGGVDSLAAYKVCLDHVDLISLDFGDKFSREKNFFKKWNPYTVVTNFRDKPFFENVDWRFMASGAILYSDYIGVDNLFFGTILEASPATFSVAEKKSFENRADYQAFKIARLRVVAPVLALSEYGSTLMASLWGGELLAESIDSAADLGTQKLFRKKLLQKIVSKEILEKEWLNFNKPKKLTKFGSSFSGDILSIYFAYKFGCDFVNSYISEINEEFVNFMKASDISFFEKYNQYNMHMVPEYLHDICISSYLKVGLKPDSGEDVVNFNNVCKFLSKYRKIN